MPPGTGPPRQEAPVGFEPTIRNLARVRRWTASARGLHVFYAISGMRDNPHPKKKRTPRSFMAFERLTQKLIAVSKAEIYELEAKRVKRRGGGRRPMLRRA